jgi:hypothetical protein
MIEARGSSSFRLATRDFPLLPRSGRREIEPEASPAETRIAPAPRVTARTDPHLRRIAAEIVRSVQSRLPGRVRDLNVRIDADQFVLSGVATSYYVKQIAQHVAMQALDARMLGRIVNEIEVRSVR